MKLDGVILGEVATQGHEYDQNTEVLKELIKYNLKNNRTFSQFQNM